MKPLQVLITNLSLSGRTGTETYTRDLALGLLALGHEPSVYSPRVGKLAEELQRAGLPVSDNPLSLPKPDIIHGHHSIPTALAILRFPQTPAIFVCHDAKAWHDEAPRLSAIQSYVAVDFLCRDRLKAEGISEDQISVIGNAVDLDRFRPRGPLPLMPRRALLFSNYASEHTHVPPIRDACAQAGLQLDVRGYGVENVCEKPETILGEYDIVFAKARCAMEAMACGASVILCGAEGAGEIVTPDRFDGLQQYNFGRHILQQPLTGDYLLTQIRRYDAAVAQQVTDLARNQLGLGHMVRHWIELYGKLRPPAEQSDDRDALARLLLALEAKTNRLAELEPKLAWLEPTYRRHDDELRLLRIQTRKAVQLRGLFKHLWKFRPARGAMYLLGARRFTESPHCGLRPSPERPQMDNP